MPRSLKDQPLNILEADLNSKIRRQIFSGNFSDISADYHLFLKDDLRAFSLWFGTLLQSFVLKREPSLENLKNFIRSAIEKDLLAIQDLLFAQVDTILHADRYQKLEGRWRGLRSLLKQRTQISQRDGKVVVRLFPVSWQEIEKDINRALDFEDTTLFRLWHENEFDHPGGEPFGLIIVDHEVSHHAKDIEVLSELSNIASASFVPVVLGVSPALFGVDNFTNLANSHYVSGIFKDNDYFRWRKLQQSENARFIGLVLPEVRARPAWSYENNALKYSETFSSSEECCWYSGIYAFAENVMRASRKFGWPADIRGVVPGNESGAFIAEKETDDFAFGKYTFLPQAALALGFTDEQERDITNSGFMLINTLVDGHIVFASTCSIQLPVPNAVKLDLVVAHERINRDLGALLCACRFAHYIKVIGRDMMGRFMTADEISQELQRWLSRYTSVNPASSAASRASYPLLSSKVSLKPVADDLEKYNCVIQIQPYYQLDDTSAVFRFTTQIPRRSR